MIYVMSQAPTFSVAPSERTMFISCGSDYNFPVLTSSVQSYLSIFEEFLKISELPLLLSVALSMISFLFLTSFILFQYNSGRKEVRCKGFFPLNRKPQVCFY